MNIIYSLTFITLWLISLGEGTITWESHPSSIQFYEDTSIGTPLLTLGASDSNSKPVQIDTENDEAGLVCNVSETTENGGVYSANVTLSSELDSDFNPSVRFLVFKASTADDREYARINLIIRDINDNAPRFLNLPYKINIPENTPIGEVIFSGLSVFDPDTTNYVDFDLIPDTITKDLVWVNRTGSDKKGQIILLQPLDYETRNAYTLNIVATDDGGLNQTTTVEVQLEDIQDTPPFFLYDVYRGAVVENSPANTSVIHVQAEDGDGDRNYQNEIAYSIIEGRTDLFHIDETTGVIYATHTMDREDPTVIDVNGVFRMVVQAKELNGTKPQYGNTTATTTVYATVEDINDNSPTFNTTEPYTAFVRSDISDGSLIYFGGDGYMQVFDRDQTGENATFSMSIDPESEYATVFTPNPVQVFSEANVLIRVTDSSVIRSMGGTHITFEVIARETDTAEGHSTRANVVLSVEQTDPPTTTPAPVKEDPLKAPDIVVFVVGFLVLLNIATSVIICYMLRSRGKNKEGLSRHGSKYYIKKRPTDFTNHATHNPSTTEMIEVDPEVAVCPRVGNGEYAE